MQIVWAVFLCVLLASSAFAADFTGQVVGVFDGDTLDVLHNGQAERIRLNGIDCPEKRQVNGKRAKHAASDLAFGKEVTIQTHGRDKYHRTIADVNLPDGRNLNLELVRDGWCWWYRKYAAGDTMLEKLEAEAREVTAGLWKAPNPIPLGFLKGRSSLRPGPHGIETTVEGRHNETISRLMAIISQWKPDSSGLLTMAMGRSLSC
jgi:endonuclease YncB( thermonuclease family)